MRFFFCQARQYFALRDETGQTHIYVTINLILDNGVLKGLSALHLASASPVSLDCHCVTVFTYLYHSEKKHVCLCGE